MLLKTEHTPRLIITVDGFSPVSTVVCRLSGRQPTRGSWLRHRAKSRKVAGSIPDGVSGTFHRHNPSGRTVAIGSIQPVTEMSTRNISWGVKAAGALGLTILPPSCAYCLEIWEPQHPGNLWVFTGNALDRYTSESHKFSKNPGAVLKFKQPEQ